VGDVNQVYKITFPNGKIYIGQDVTGTLRYFGSWKVDLVAADLTAEQLRDLTLRKQILWESETATKAEVTGKEVELIFEHESNNPALGYTLRPRYRPSPAASSS
jgi:hypothetical protein